MLKGLKEKFLDVTKTVGLLKEEPKQTRTLNLDAGAGILSHFQRQWEELHELNECNARRAAEIAEQITGLNGKLTKEREYVVQFSTLIHSVPSITECVDKCAGLISDLYESFEEVERSLIHLEDVIEQLELKEAKMRQEKQLEAYEKLKLAELEEKKLELAEKMRTFQFENESRENKMRQERQKVFQEAFNADLETFKELGTIPKIENINKSSALLEEIHLEYDEQELDQFFKD